MPDRIPTSAPTLPQTRSDPDVRGDDDVDEDWVSLADSEITGTLLTILAVIGVLGSAAILGLGMSCVAVLNALG